jgi:hypothetical protein
VVAQFRSEVGDCVACFGEKADLKVEVVPHAVEPAVVEEGRLRSGTGDFDLVCIDGYRIVTSGLHDDRRQVRHIAVHRRDAGQPRIE